MRAASEADPAPEPPQQPDFDECCGSGCNPCIFDVYAQALERYQAKLKVWRERHVDRPLRARQPTQLLFLPGAGGIADFWQPVSDLLVHPASRRLLGWPGFGAQPADPGVRGLADLVDRVTAAIDQPTALVAQSMGGVVAVQAVLRKPAQVTHLVLVATSGGIDLSGFDVEDWRPAFFEAHPQAPHWFADDASDLSASLHRLDVPVLLLWGDDDRVSPVGVGRRLQASLPNSRLEVLAGGAHDFANRLAQRVAPLIDAHLATAC